MDEFCVQEPPRLGYTYPHARNLGFAAATLVTAFSEQAADAKDDIDAINRIAGVLTTVVGHASGGAAAENLMSAAGEWALDDYGTRTKTAIDDGLADLIDDIRPRLLPPHFPGDGPPGYGAATRAWLDVYAGILPGA